MISALIVTAIAAACKFRAPLPPVVHRLEHDHA
jgi:hypothetical protein